MTIHIPFEKEGDMLEAFDSIEDADILSDGTVKVMISHTVNRVKRILSKDDTRRFLLMETIKKT